MCDWITVLYSRKLTEPGTPAITEKNKKHQNKKKKEFTKLTCNKTKNLVRKLEKGMKRRH